MFRRAAIVLAASLLGSLIPPPAVAQQDFTVSIAEASEEAVEAYRSGLYSEAQTQALLMLERARAADELETEAFALHLLGCIAQAQMNYAAAITRFQSSLSLYTRLKLPERTAKILSDLGETHHLQGDYSQALDYHYRALSLLQSADNHAGVIREHLNIGSVMQDLGQLTPALNAFLQALELQNEQQEPEAYAATLLSLGQIHTNLGDYGEASVFLSDALATARTHKLTSILAQTQQARGQLAIRQGQLSTAAEELDAAQSLFEILNQAVHQTEVAALMGEVQLQSGEIDLGLATLHDAQQRATAQGQRRLANDIHLALAEAYLRQNNSIEALKHANAGFENAKTFAEVAVMVEFQKMRVRAHLLDNDYRAAYLALEQQVSLQSQSDQQAQAISLSKLQADIALERQAQAIERLNKNQAIALARAEQRNLRNTMTMGGLVAFSLFLLLLYSRAMQSRRNVDLTREVKRRTQELEEKAGQLEEANRTLEQVSLRDRLTGLFNRHYLEAHLPAEIQRCQHGYTLQKQNSNADLIAFLLDIDDFKHINDQYGHISGDRFLVQFTHVLQEVFRQTDLLIRWGGEEFLVICRYVNRNDAPILAERLLQQIRETEFQLDKHHRINATCSVGFCVMPVYTNEPYRVDWQTTFEIIDYCLYASKLSGKDCWVGITGSRTEAIEDSEPSALEQKFALPRLRYATSLNHLSNIHWPEEQP